MSKIQDAIRASRDRAQNAGVAPMARRRLSNNAHDKLPAVPIQIDGMANVELDSEKMERSCLLPYIQDKAAANAYMLLRTRLLKRLRDNNWKSLMVVGTVPNDGKTTTAINLAIGLSQDVGQIVVLVDLDLERPSIATYLGIDRTAGLSDYLSGDVGPHEVLYNTDVDRLLLLPNFDPMSSSELFTTPKIPALLNYIKSVYPNLLLIFDMPPVLSSDSVLAMAPHVDALLLVISEGHTSRSLLQRVNQMIDEIPRAGVVLNRSTEGNTGGYY